MGLRFAKIRGRMLSLMLGKHRSIRRACGAYALHRVMLEPIMLTTDSNDKSLRAAALARKCVVSPETTNTHAIHIYIQTHTHIHTYVHTYITYIYMNIHICVSNSQ